MNALEVQALSKSYADVVAVDRLSFSVAQGQLCGLVGPDGAGKTTTLKLLAGILTPDSGTATVMGLDLNQQRGLAKMNVGYMAQDFTLYGDLTAEENLLFFGEVFGLSRQKRKGRAQELLTFTNLFSVRQRLADQFSGGMRRRLSLACALVHQPKVLLLDEPTTGIDPLSRRELWHLFHRLLREGTTILLASPYMSEADLCQQVALISRGRLLQSAPPQTLRGMVPHTVLELIAQPLAQAYALTRDLPEILSVARLGDSLHLTTTHPQAAGEWVRQRLTGSGVVVQSIAPVAPTMEDVFLSLQLESREKGPP